MLTIDTDFKIIHKISEICRWIASLSHLWSRRVDLLNRGFSGFNSRWGLSIINEVVTSHRPHLVMIFFGANDAVIDGVGSFVPLNEYEENLKMMVTTIQKVSD